MASLPPSDAGSLFFAPDSLPPESFFGRALELGRLEDWFASDKSLLIISGLGGTGKTELTRQFIGTLGHLFASGERTPLWCSLRDAPSVATVASGLSAMFPDAPLSVGTADPALRIELLLSSKPTLLVLDNLEAVLRRDGAEIDDYERLLTRLAETRGSMKVLITTRVLPDLNTHGRGPQFESLHLGGLDAVAADELVRSLDIRGSRAKTASFSERYSGNPLALMLASELVRDLFGGDVESFLEAPSFGDVDELLLAHFDGLAEVELLALRRLATSREPLTVPALVEGTSLERRERDVVSALRSLLRRSLIENREGRFFLQYLVQEHVLRHYVDALVEAVLANSFEGLAELPLVDTQRPIHVRETQRRLTVGELARGGESATGGRRQFLALLVDGVERARVGGPLHQGFLASNAVELTLAMGESLGALRLRRTRLRNLDLSDVSLRGIDLTGCEFDNCRFAAIHEHIFGLALASGGHFAALGQAGGAIVLVDVPSGRVLKVFDWDAVWLRAVAISRDDRLLAATDDRGRIRVVNLETGSARDYAGNGRQIRSLAFSEDGELLFAGGEDGVVRRMDPLGPGAPETVLTAESEVWSLAASARNLAITTAKIPLRLWEISEDREIAVDWREGESGRSLTFVGNDERVVVGCDDGHLRVWSTDGRRIASVPGHEGPVWGLAAGLLESRQAVFSGSHDGTVRQHFMQPDGGLETSRVLMADEGPVWPVCIDKGASILATVSGSSIVRFWNPQSLESIERLRGALQRVFVLATNEDGNLVASGGQDGVVRLWDGEMNRCLSTLPGHRAGIRALAFSPSGQSLASAGEDWDVRVWDAAEGKLRSVLEGPKNWVWCLAFDASGRYLAAGSADQCVHIWDLLSGYTSRRLAGHQARVVGLGFLGSGLATVSSSVDGECWLWDAASESGALVYSADGGSTTLAVVDDTRFAIGDRSGTVSLVSVVDPLTVHQVKTHEVPISSLRVVPGSNSLLVGGEDGSIVRVDLSRLRVAGRRVVAGSSIHSIVPIGRGAVAAVAVGTEEISVVSSRGFEKRRVVTVPRQYEGMIIRDCRGLSGGEIQALLQLGAVLTGPENTPTRGVEIAAITAGSVRPTTVFISYSHRDEFQMHELRAHLAGLEGEGLVEVWSDRQVPIGAEWDGEIDTRLESADIVLVLVSSDLMASSYCRMEMRRAVARAEAGECLVVPVLLRPCDWEVLPIHRFQGLPSNLAPISRAPDQDEARAEVAAGVRRLVNDWSARQRPSNGGGGGA